MNLYYRKAETVASPTRLAVMLHGRGSDEEDLLPLAPVFGPAVEVVSVRAPIPFGPGYAWYGMRPDGSPDRQEWPETVAALDALVNDLAGERSVLLLGFSQGGMMAQALAVHRHTRGIDGVITLSAPPLLDAPPPGALEGLAVFWGHGRQDPVVSPARGDETLAKLEAAGARVTARRYPIPHTISQPELQDVERWLHEIGVKN